MMLAALLAVTLQLQKPEVVYRFNGAMPTGVTVSHRGRIFVCYPRWGDPLKATVAELVRGEYEVPFPSATMNMSPKDDPVNRLVSVQSVQVDPFDRLWIVDTWSVQFGPVLPGGAKLVCVNLSTNEVMRTIPIKKPAIHDTSYLNDIRFDLTRGKGYAFLTDSADKGANGIVVVDLGTGEAWRRLNDHPSTKADPSFVPEVEGKKLMQRPKGKPAQRLKVGADGIAISADGKSLFYCPLISTKLYSVSVNALVDRSMTEEQVAATVKDWGEKGASDGLEMDASGNIYLTDYQNNSVKSARPGTNYDTVLQLDKHWWPDTLFNAVDGNLYVIANQLQRQPMFNEGKDLRQKPYILVRIQAADRPVLTRRVF